jgi:hypothetical protein
MPNYLDMCDTAKAARNEFIAYRDRCWRYLGSIINGLTEHCAIPRDQITFLKWNRHEGVDRKYLPPDSPTGLDSLPSAVEFDDLDGYMHLGVRICLTPHGPLPIQFVTFVLWVSEQNGAPLVKIGIDAKPKTAFLDNETGRNIFCDGIAGQIIRAYSDRKTAAPKTAGFDLNVTEKANDSV